MNTYLHEIHDELSLEKARGAYLGRFKTVGLRQVKFFKTKLKGIGRIPEIESINYQSIGVISNSK